MDKRIPIKALKAVIKEFDLTHLVLFARGADFVDHIASYGSTVENCSEAADFGNAMKKVLRWPEDKQADPPTVVKLRKRLKELEDAIREHAAQRGDDRCFLDDLKLYKLIGIDSHPGLKLPEEEFISNCRRYWKCQQTGEEYKTNPEPSDGREWLLKDMEDARREVSEWPEWMQKLRGE